MTRIKIVKVYIAAVVAIVNLGQGLELVVAVAATKTFHVNFLGMWTIASALGNASSSSVMVDAARSSATTTLCS